MNFFTIFIISFSIWFSSDFFIELKHWLEYIFRDWLKKAYVNFSFDIFSRVIIRWGFSFFEGGYEAIFLEDKRVECW